MFYVQANDYYYPSGGFRDIYFKGSYEDCCNVVEILKRKDRYDNVEIVTDEDVITDLSYFT